MALASPTWMHLCLRGRRDGEDEQGVCEADEKSFSCVPCLGAYGAYTSVREEDGWGNENRW
jgi:hypothetical protein